MKKIWLFVLFISLVTQAQSKDLCEVAHKIIENQDDPVVVLVNLPGLGNQGVIAFDYQENNKLLDYFIDSISQATLSGQQTVITSNQGTRDTQFEFSYYPSLSNHLLVSVEFLKNNKKYEMSYEEEPFLDLQREVNGKIIIPTLSFSQGFNIFQYDFVNKKWFIPPQGSDMKFAINQMAPEMDDIYLIHYSASIHFSDGKEYFPITFQGNEVDLSKIPLDYQEKLKNHFNQINLNKYTSNARPDCQF